MIWYTTSDINKAKSMLITDPHIKKKQLMGKEERKKKTLQFSTKYQT